jgi:hypothetical protein
MGEKADTENSPESVVQRYMSAARENNRSDAEQLLSTLQMGLPRYGMDARPSAKGGFDWFRYFHERDFLLSETCVLELSGLWAAVEAKCILLDEPVATTRQTAIFRLFRENGCWLISDISLSLDANVSRDDSN